MAPRAKPFRFTDLERWTRSQLLVLKTFMAYLPGSGLGPEFKQALRDALSRLTGTEVDIWLDSIARAPAGALLKKLPDPACLAVIGLPPSNHHLILDLDLRMAGMAVDRMLGGTGEDVDASRPLSSIETGLASFVLLRVMQAAQAVLQEEQQVGLRLQKLHDHPSGVAELIGAREYVVLGFKLFLDMEVGYARLLVPAEMVRTQLAGAVDPSGPVFARRLQALRARIPRIASTKTVLTVEAGRAELGQDDLDNVGEGDILMVEHTGLRMQDGVLSGDVEIRVGGGEHGVVRGTLVELQDGGQGVEVSAIEISPEPEAAGDDVGHADAASPHDAVEGGDEDAPQEDAAATPLKPRGQFPRQDVRNAFAGQSRGQGGDARDEAPQGEHHVEEDEEQPQEEQYEEGGEAQEEEAAPQDNLGETEGLLKDIAMPVVIELGRIKTTAGDVLNLRAGQILELHRAPNDPVDITVNGKLIGKGELVEVEGELGVRLLSLNR